MLIYHIAAIKCRSREEAAWNLDNKSDMRSIYSDLNLPYELLFFVSSLMYSQSKKQPSDARTRPADEASRQFQRYTGLQNANVYIAPPGGAPPSSQRPNA